MSDNSEICPDKHRKKDEIDLDQKYFNHREIREIVRKAMDGEPKAVEIILSRIARYAQPSDMLPEEFLLYCGEKAYQLHRHQDIKVMTRLYLKMPKSISLNLALVKMVVYLTEVKKVELKDAFKKVADEVCQGIDSVKNIYYQWPPAERKNHKVTPNKYVQGLPRHRKINSETEYQHVRENVRNKRWTPFPKLGDPLPEIFLH